MKKQYWLAIAVTAALLSAAASPPQQRAQPSEAQVIIGACRVECAVSPEARTVVQCLPVSACEAISQEGCRGSLLPQSWCTPRE